MGEATRRSSILRPLADSGGKDVTTRRLLAQALARRKERESVLELEAAHAAAPDDLELSFALGRGYLELKKVDLAARLFDQILAARPIPQTQRPRSAGRTATSSEYDRARAELRAASKRDPRVRRAHYYLGHRGRPGEGAGRARGGDRRVPGRAEGCARRPPGEPRARRGPGRDASGPRRPCLPSRSPRAPTPARELLYYLGRAQLARDQAADAVVSLGSALKRRGGRGGQRARAARRSTSSSARRCAGWAAPTKPRVHFAEGRAALGRGNRCGARTVGALHDRLAVPKRRPTKSPAVPLIETSPLAALPPPQKQRAQGAADRGPRPRLPQPGRHEGPGAALRPGRPMFEQAANVDPDFPQVQSSLGVAYFNAEEFDKATGSPRAGRSRPTPRSRAEAAAGHGLAQHRDLRQGRRAPARRSRARCKNPSLQFAYGLALVKSGRAAEAERDLLGPARANGDSAELNVVLGQAHAAAGRLRLGDRAAPARAASSSPTWPRPTPPSASSTASRAARPRPRPRCARSSRSRPNDVQSQQNLAAVLESQQRPEEALALLRGVLAGKPDFAEARYLFGKILLAQGDAEGAATAARGGRPPLPRRRLTSTTSWGGRTRSWAGPSWRRRSSRATARSRTSVDRRARPPRHSGSRTVRTWSAVTPVRVCVFPEGQAIVSSLTTASAPRPKWTRRSDAQP